MHSIPNYAAREPDAMTTPITSNDPLVSIRDLKVTFRLDRHSSFEAVKGISFDIPRNAIPP